MTNSSSTNFLIISKKELDADYLVKKLGFKAKSKLQFAGEELAQSIMAGIARGPRYFEVDDINYNALDSWYPLLPRRVNGSAEIKLPLDDVVYWGERNSMDQYNMCPDCGNFFGLEDDGGNDFCVNCAWKH